MAVGIQQLASSARHLPRLFRSPVLRLFALTCAIEGALLALLPGQLAATVGVMMSAPLSGIFSAIDSSVGTTIALVIVLFAVDLFRQGLWGPAYRIALDDIDLAAGEAVRESLNRIARIFVVQQVIGIFVFLVTALSFLIGLNLLVIPHAIVGFTLAPAIYLVAAHDRSIGDAIVEAVGITRRHPLAVFGVQSVLLALAYWIGQFLQGAACNYPLEGAMILAWSGIAMLLFYRFANFFGMTVLYFALDEAEGF